MAKPTQSLEEIMRLSARLNDLLDQNQAAAFLHVTPGTLAVWRSTGRYSIPFVKVGRNVRYKLPDLIEWVDSRTRSNGATA